MATRFVSRERLRTALKVPGPLLLAMVLAGLVLIPHVTSSAVRSAGDHLSDSHLAVQVVAIRDRLPAPADLGAGRHDTQTAGVLSNGLQIVLALGLALLLWQTSRLPESRRSAPSTARGPPGAPRAH